MNYLETYKMEIGLLINFGAKSLEFKRVHNNKRPNHDSPDYHEREKKNHDNPLVKNNQGSDNFTTYSTRNRPFTSISLLAKFSIVTIA